MIRWKYAIPRLVVMGLVVAALGLGLDPLIKWSLAFLGESLTGAKVVIGDVRTSWTGTKLKVTDVQISDPQGSAQDLFQADSISLDVDGHWLSRRKLVVHGGEARGLRFATQRDSSGPPAPGQPTDGSSTWQEDMAQRGK